MPFTSLKEKLASQKYSVSFGEVVKINATVITATGLKVSISDMVKIISNDTAQETFGMVTEIDGKTFFITPFSFVEGFCSGDRSARSWNFNSVCGSCSSDDDLVWFSDQLLPSAGASKHFRVNLDEAIYFYPSGFSWTGLAEVRWDELDCNRFPGFAMFGRIISRSICLGSARTISESQIDHIS